MNEENNSVYNQYILPRGFLDYSANMKNDGLRPTNRRLIGAFKQIDTYLRSGLAQNAPERQVETLIRWQKFIDTKARILAVFVSDEFSAYRMFETLNDRGLRASQVDILKNYLFSRCDTRLDEAKAFWRQIDTIIEPLGGRREPDEDDDQDESKSGDPLIHFFRHLWVTLHGATKSKNLAEKIRLELTNESRVMKFLAEAADAARSYVASFRGDDPKWKGYPPTAKQDIETLNEHLRINQIRPLLFAIAHYLEPKEAAKALRLCVSWSVRFLIVGGRGGMLDVQYSRRAEEIGTGSVSKARELRENMSSYVPSNEEFEQNFAVARVSRGWLARYLIRAIQKHVSELPYPEYVANDEVSQVNLEHFMPKNLSSEWNVDQDVAEASINLLGNQFLLPADKNKDLGNAGFERKKAILAKSAFSTTNMICDYTSWGREDILHRQKHLASHAVATWPVTFND
ncbi:HNH endonuclease family protein [Aurantimonas sp. C2-6-R+9]|nr:HNH endonuclease family protein [Aurantimonas sp. C2-6-R+9]